MEKQLNEIKRMQKIAGLLKENEEFNDDEITFEPEGKAEINTISELEKFLTEFVKDYIGDTIEIVGSEEDNEDPLLDWGGGTIGMSKEEATNDFIDYIKGDI